MPLGAPLTLPVSGVTPDLAVHYIGQLSPQKTMSSLYRSTDGKAIFDVEHSLSGSRSGSRVKSQVHLELRKPKDDNPQDYHSLHVRVILDRPEAVDATFGFTETEVDKALGRLAAFVGTSANVTKIITLQS
jgi:hypothetical protein